MAEKNINVVDFLRFFAFYVYSFTLWTQKLEKFSCILNKFVMHTTNNQFSEKLNNEWKKWPIYCDFTLWPRLLQKNVMYHAQICTANNQSSDKFNNGGGLLSSVLLLGKAGGRYY